MRLSFKKQRPLLKRWKAFASEHFRCRNCISNIIFFREFCMFTIAQVCRYNIFSLLWEPWLIFHLNIIDLKSLHSCTVHSQFPFDKVFLNLNGISFVKISLVWSGLYMIQFVRIFGSHGRVINLHYTSKLCVLLTYLTYTSIKSPLEIVRLTTNKWL